MLVALHTKLVCVTMDTTEYTPLKSDTRRIHYVVWHETRLHDRLSYIRRFLTLDRGEWGRETISSNTCPIVFARYSLCRKR